MRFLRILAAIMLFLALPPTRASVPVCTCDVSKPATLAVSQCGLCRIAEAQPAEPQFFIIKDGDPQKPNRWLALPRFHSPGLQHLSDMTPAQRTAYWSTAIAKAQALWGDQWGLAFNGDDNRTQCHAHIHIGKLLDGAEKTNFVVVDGPAQVPVPTGGHGILVHPVGGKLHAHVNLDAPELLLMR
jgi:diadenosine tetraphosphate (Ap4A) HIT family hydrolase